MARIKYNASDEVERAKGNKRDEEEKSAPQERASSSYTDALRKSVEEYNALPRETKAAMQRDGSFANVQKYWDTLSNANEAATGLERAAASIQAHAKRMSSNEYRSKTEVGMARQALNMYNMYADRLRNLNSVLDPDNATEYMRGATEAKNSARDYAEQLAIREKYAEPKDWENYLRDAYYAENGSDATKEAMRMKKEAMSAPDFAQYSVKTEEAKPKQNATAINPNAGMVDPFAETAGMWSEYFSKPRGQLTEDEQATYRYYLAKEKAGLVPEGTAQKYINGLTEVLASRGGQELADEIKDDWVSRRMFDFYSGVNQYVSGMIGAVDFIRGNPNVYYDEANYARGELQQDYSFAEKTLSDAIMTTVNMLPSWGLGLATGNNTVSAVSMGVSAAGNAYKDMLQKGYSVNQARVVGVMVGLSETLLEKLIGVTGGEKFKGAASTALRKFTSGWSHAWLQTLVRGGGELILDMLGESLEEGLQEIMEPYFEAMVGGEAPESIDWEAVGYAALLGGLSAAPIGVVGTGIDRVQYKSVVKDAIARGDTQALVNLGLSFAEGTEARQLAERYARLTEEGAVPTRRDVAGLANMLESVTEEGEIEDQQVLDVVNSLYNSGARQYLDNDYQLTDLADGILNDGKYSKRLNTLMDANPELADIVADVAMKDVADSASSVNKRLSNLSTVYGQQQIYGKKGEYLDYRNRLAQYNSGMVEMSDQESAGGSVAMTTEGLARRTSSNAGSKIAKARQAKGLPYQEQTARSSIEADEGAVNALKSKRNAGSVNVQSTGNNAPVRIDGSGTGIKYVVYKDGTKRRTTNAVYENESQRAAYNAVARLDVDAETANTILQTVDMNASPADVVRQVLGLSYAYRIGKVGASTESPDFAALTRGLSKRQVNIAYNRGKAVNEQNAKAIVAAEKQTATAQQKALDQAKAKAETEAKPKRAGWLHTDGVDNMDTLDDTRKESINYVAELVNEYMHNDVYLFESVVKNGKRVLAKDIPGTKHKAGDPALMNGMHDPKTGVIYLDVNAGDFGSGTILYSAAHEYYHFIKKNAPAKAVGIAEALVSAYGTDTIEDLISRKQEQYAEAGKKLTHDEALEDVVAEALSKMFTDRDLMGRLERLRAKDKTLWQRLKDFFTGLRRRIRAESARIKAQYEDFAVTAPKEAKMLDQLEADVDRIADMFAEALYEAGKNFEATASPSTEARQSLGEENIDGEKTSHAYSLRSYTEGCGYAVKYDEDGNVEIDDHGLVIYNAATGERINSADDIDIDVIRVSPLGQLVEASIFYDENGDVLNDKQAKKQKDQQLKTLREILAMCMRTQDLSLPWEAVGSAIFSALKDNSDKQYGKTVDFSTICKKTQAIINVISEANVRLGRGLTTKEIRSIVYEETGKAGEPTPCPVCYVFSRWMGLGGILDNMYKFQTRTNDWSQERVEGYVETIREEARKFAKEYAKADYKAKNGSPAYGKILTDMKAAAGKKIDKLQEQLDEHYDSVDVIRMLTERRRTELPEMQERTQKVIDSLQAKLLTEEQIDDIEDTIRDLYENGDPEAKTTLPLAQLELYQFLMSSRYVGTKKVVYDASYKPYTDMSAMKNAIFDLRNAETLVKDYPQLWRYRNSRGCSAGKAILPYSEAVAGEFIQGIGDADIALGGEQRRKKNMWQYGSLDSGKNHVNKRKEALTKARNKARAQNLIGGQRYQSTSDFRHQYALDYYMSLLEMQAIGSNVQLYTKVIEAVDFFASCGCDVNMSVMPYGNGYDADGNLLFSPVTGINGDAAIAMTKKYDNAQLILVGISDEHIRLALEGDVVSFVIPFHGSGNSVAAIQEMMNLLKEDLDLTTARDYTKVQTDHERAESTYKDKAEYQRHKSLRTIREKIITGKALTNKERELMEENEFLPDLYRRFRVDKTAAEYGVKLTKDQAENIFPYEYWDKTLRIEDADENGRRFIRYCESLGIYPRFSGITDKYGKMGEFGDFTSTKGYWKLLIDRRMYDLNGNYREQKKINVTNMNPSWLSPEWAKDQYGERSEHNVMQKDSSAKSEVTMGIVRNVLQRIASRDPNALRALQEMQSGDEDQNAAAEVEPAETNGGMNYSLRVTDTDEIKRLDAEPKLKLYRSMVLIDGKLYSPMATYIDGKPSAPYEIGNWYRSEEKFELARVKKDNKTKKPIYDEEIDDWAYEFPLVKGGTEPGEKIGTIWARYNPYEHQSNSPINDQFSSAYKRPNLVVVEFEVPASEANGEYRAPHAKDKTGWLDWHSGKASADIKKAGGEARRVFLSRWAKPVRVLGHAEVAQEYKRRLAGTGVKVKDNTVPPGLLAELRKAGVPIEESGLVKYQLRNNDPYSSRSLLSSALEGAAQTDAERRMLENYQAEATALDDMQARLTEVRGEIRDMMFRRGSRDDAYKAKLAALREEATKLANRITIADKKLLRMEATAPLKAVVESEKAKAVKRTKQQYQERIQADRDRSVSKDLQADIRGMYTDLKNRLTAGRKNKAIPEPYVDGLITVLQAIDPTLPSLLRVQKTDENGRAMVNRNGQPIYRYAKDGEFTQEQIDAGLANGTMRYTNQEINEKYRSYLDVLDGVRKVYERTRAASVIDPETNEEIVNDNDVRNAYDPEFAGYIAELIANVKDKPISAMTRAELEQTYALMKKIWHRIRDAKRLIGEGHAETLAESRARIKSQTAALPEKIGDSKIDDLSRKWATNPVRIAREMSGYNEDSELYRLFMDIVTGWGKGETFRMNAENVINMTRSSKTDRKRYQDAVTKETITMTDVNGKKFKISLMQGMQLVLTYEREISNANHKHLEYSTYFPDLKLMRKGKVKEAIANAHQAAVADGELINRIMDIIGRDEWAQRFMDAAKTVLREMSTNALNETSMVIDGVPIARENAYIPYMVSPYYINGEATNQAGQKSVLNLGMTKALIPNAGTPILISGLNTVLDDHIGEVAKYYGMAIPVRNWNAVLNKGQAANKTPIREVLDKRFGNGYSILNQAVADIQDPGKKEEDPMGFLRAAFVAATLIGNVSVTLKQMASYPTAGVYLSQASLAAGVKQFFANAAKMQEVYEEVDKYTPYLYMRRKGLSSPEIADLKAGTNFVSKISFGLPAVVSPMKWIQQADVNTTTALWFACKHEIAKTTKASDPSFMKKVAALYEKVLSDTQPMYDSLHRAGISKNSGASRFFMFKTQPLQNSGIMRDAAQNLRFARAGKNSAQVKAASKQFARAVTSQLITATVFTTFTMLARAIQHNMNSYRDDDDKLTWQSIFQQMLKDSGKTLFSVVFPIVGDVSWELAEKFIERNATGNVISDPTVEMIADFVNTTITAWSVATDPDKDITVEILSKFIGKTLGMAGIPASNIGRFTKGIVLHAQDIANKEFLSFNAGFDMSSGAKDKQLYEAMLSGDKAAIETAKRDYMTAKDWHSKLRKLLRSNDPRIVQSAQANLEQNYDLRQRLLSEIKDEGHFEIGDITQAERSEIDDLRSKLNGIATAIENGDQEKAEKLRKELLDRGYEETFIDKNLEGASYQEKPAWWETTEATNDTAVSQFNSKDLAAALLEGNDADRQMVYDALVEEYKAAGKTQADAVNETRSKFKSAITVQFKSNAIDSATTREYLQDYAGIKGDDLFWEMDKLENTYVLDPESGHRVETNGYSKWNTLYEAVESGKNLDAAVRKYTSHGIDAGKVADKISDKYKPIYDNATPAERERMIPWLCKAYEACGKDYYEKKNYIEKHWGK